MAILHEHIPIINNEKACVRAGSQIYLLLVPRAQLINRQIKISITDKATCGEINQRRVYKVLY